MSTQSKVEAWHKQDGEGDAAFEAFSFWLTNIKVWPPKKLEGRNIEGSAIEKGAHQQTWHNFSMRWHWLERARQYDRMLENEAIEARKQAVRQMNIKHLRIAEKALRLVERVIDYMNAEQETRETDDQGTKIDQRFIGKLLELGTKLERLIHGEATDRQEVRKDDDLDLSQLTDEELVQFEALKLKARRREY